MHEGLDFDKCPDCPHSWHGLTCTAPETRREKGYVVQGMCKCPSSFNQKD